LGKVIPHRDEATPPALEQAQEALRARIERVGKELAL
jgi:hypothetical protein